MQIFLEAALISATQVQIHSRVPSRCLRTRIFYAAEVSRANFSPHTDHDVDISIDARFDLPPDSSFRLLAGRA